MHPETPYLLPDRRWRRACDLVEHGGYATLRRDGELVQRTVRCLRRLRRATTERGIRSAAKACPDVFVALKLSGEPTRRLLEVRARLLAAQSDRAIARAVGLPTRAVAAYAGLFFDVRPRLQATVWIGRFVIGLPHEGPPSLEALLLLHCWRRGPTAVDAWLDYLDHAGERHDLSTEAGRRRAALQLLIDVHQLPEDAKTRLSLVKRLPFITEEYAETALPSSLAGVFCRSTARILAGIAWTEPAAEPSSDCARTRGPRHDCPGRERRPSAKAG